MEPLSMSIIFAKAYGIYFFVVGLALFLNPERFRAWYLNIISEDRRGLFGGMLALLIGSFIIALHNVWVADWPILITLIGYYGVAKGAGLMIIPAFVDGFKSMVNSSDQMYKLSGLAWAALGVFFFYQGFIA